MLFSIVSSRIDQIRVQQLHGVVGCQSRDVENFVEMTLDDQKAILQNSFYARSKQSHKKTRSNPPIYYYFFKKSTFRRCSHRLLSTLFVFRQRSASHEVRSDGDRHRGICQWQR